MYTQLSGKTILVTGSTKGIGAGIARSLNEQGAKVVISGRDGEAGRRTCLNMPDRDRVAFVPMDVREPADCAAAIGETVRIFGTLDGLVNNAGIFPNATLLDTHEDLFSRVFDVNIKGAFFCSQSAVAYMAEHGGGSIVHIGSTHAYGGGKTLAAYACSKGALRTLNQHIALHYAASLIRSNWITVGWVMSDGEKEKVERLHMTPEQYDAISRDRMPMKRLQTAEEIGRAVCYFMSDAAQSVTGTEMHITGGHWPAAK